MNPAGMPDQARSAESGTGRAHSAHPLILVAAAAVLVALALVLLVAGFVAGSTALLWIAVIAAALALGLWVAERRAAGDLSNEPAVAGPAIGLLVAQRGPTGH